MKFKTLSLASAALLPLSAHAQDRDDRIVVVATGVEQRADRAGRAVTVIERDEIERRQIVSVADLLTTTPGVSTTRAGGVGGVTSVRIRGAEADHTLVLIDGVRVNDPSSPAAAFDFGNLLSGSVERVEVLRGPNSVAWGSQAIGGVVNVVTHLPAGGLSGRASAEYGYANQFSASAAIAAGNDTVQGALTGGYLRNDGISQAASGSERDGYRQKNASARLKAEFAPGFGVDLRGYYADSRIEADGFPAPAYRFADTDEVGTAREHYGYAGLFGTLGPVKSRLAFTIADINRDNYDPMIGSAPLYLYRGRSERYEYQGDARLADQIRIVFGAERENVRLYDGGATHRAGITAFYGEAIVTPIDRVTITAGVRNDDHSRFGRHVSWGVNTAIHPAEGMVLRGSYGEAFKAPTLYQLFAPFYGTLTLRPETARSWEVGADLSLLGGKARLSATWFNRDTRNQIDFDLVTYTYGNLAHTRAKGAELELALRPVETLTVTANYTHVRADNRSAGFAGKDLAVRPRDMASLSADWRTPIGLSLGVTVSIVGDSFNDKANLTRLDGYALAGIRAELPIGDRFALYGRVDNLADAKYQVFSGYGTYGRAVYGGARVRFD